METLDLKWEYTHELWKLKSERNEKEIFPNISQILLYSPKLCGGVNEILTL
jgi:hypothetical protein